MTNTVTIPVNLGGTNVGYNDGTGAYGMRSNNGYGYTTYMIPMLSEVIAACAIAVSSAAAATNAANVNGTSTSAVSITGTGLASFVMVEADRAIVPGMFLVFADAANPTGNYIVGQVDSWNSGTRTVQATRLDAAGSGTISSWKVSLSGAMSATSGETTTSLGALINGATTKATPVDADQLALMDSAASNVVKKLSWANLKATLWTSLGALVAGGTTKATPVDADTLPLSDSAASDATKKLTWANLKATLWVALGPAIAALTSKATPVGADEVAITDSAASGATKRVSLTNLAAFLASLTQTLTNKRMTARTSTEASSATPTINTDNVDLHSVTALAVAITSMTTNLTGTPNAGDVLFVEITGTATRAITWGAKFEASTVALPTTTSGTDKLTVSFIWNTVSSKWRCMGVA